MRIASLVAFIVASGMAATSHAELNVGDQAPGFTVSGTRLSAREMAGVDRGPYPFAPCSAPLLRFGAHTKIGMLS